MGVISRADVVRALAAAAVTGAPSRASAARHRAQLRAAARGASARRRAVRRREGERLRPRRRGGSARRACRRRDLARRGHRRRGRGPARRGDRRAAARDGRAHARPTSTPLSPRDADVVAWTRELVEARRRARRPARVHVKLDSGMGRLGTKDPREARSRVCRSRSDGRPRARRPDDPLRDGRRARRRPLPGAARTLHRAGRARCAPSIPACVVHAANSAGLLRDPAAHFDMARCGIAIYGLDPFGDGPRASTASSRRSRSSRTWPP